MIIKNYFLGLWIVLGFSCPNLSLAQSSELKIPSSIAPVMDQVGVMDSRSLAQLNNLLRDWKTRGIQMSVLITPDLAGLSIEEYSIKVVEQWKLGNADTDKGLLLLVAPNDRKVRIEVGQGLEGDLPDAYAKRVIDQRILPEFKIGDYSMGIEQGVLGIIQYVDPEFLNTKGISSRRAQKKQSLPAFYYLIFFVISLLSMFFRGFGRRRGISYWGGGGGFGGRSSGGSSWGGGGGGFSGGGASGSW